MAQRKRLIFTAAFVAVMATPTIAQAQCGCSAINNSPNSGDIVFFQDASLNDYVGFMQEAVNKLENRLQAVHATFHVRLVSGGGRGVFVHVDPNLTGTDVWAVSQGDEIRINANALMMGDNFIRFTFLHEFMHQLGYLDIGFGCPENSSVMQPSDPKDSILTNLTISDRCGMRRDFGSTEENQEYFNRCDPASGEDACDPIIVSLEPGGLHLSPSEVWFDLSGTGQPRPYSWTAAGSEDGFLVLDLDANGRIDSGREMFGNVMELSGRLAENGFDALAWYDRPEKGGNGDGWISSADAVFGHLQLWFDRNHNGVTDDGELRLLQDCGVSAIGLAVSSINRRDQHDNYFALRGSIRFDTPYAGVNRYVFDVFLARK